MDRTQFIEMLEERHIPFIKAEDTGLWKQGYDGIYVKKKGEFEKKKQHPRKYKDLYVPEFRVSGFNETLYVRENGWCQYINDDYLMNLVEEYSN